MKALVVVLATLIRLVFTTQSSQQIGVGPIPFSGVYQPSLRFQPDDSVGAFLVPKARFINSVVPILNTSDYKSRFCVDESALDTVLRAKCPSCLNFLTRDFMDFFVEHLPSTIDQLDPSQRDAMVYLASNLKKTAKKLRLLAAPAWNNDKRLNETVAVLVYNGDLTRRVSSKMKTLMFQAAFWSVYRYYHNVVVVTKNAVEYNTVLGLKMPVFELINLDVTVGNKTKRQPYAVRATFIHGALMKGALEVAAVRMHQDVGWSGFQYVYFSSAVQLLHSRRFRNIYDTMDSGSEGNFLIAPHRMQTLPLAQNFPADLQSELWPESEAGRAPSAQWVPHAQLMTERLLGVTGSCCEQGRVLFPSCSSPVLARPQVLQGSQGSQGGATLHRAVNGTATTATGVSTAVNSTHSMGTNSSSSGARKCAGADCDKQAQQQLRRLPWTACTEWGSRNFSTWLRVGPDGFTMPPVTVHRAYCEYSAVPRQCPLAATLPAESAPQQVGQQQQQRSVRASVPCTQPGVSSRVPVRVSPGVFPAETTAVPSESAPASSALRGTSAPLRVASVSPPASAATYHYCQESPVVRLNPYTVHLLTAETQLVLRQDEASIHVLADSDLPLGHGRDPQGDYSAAQVAQYDMNNNSGAAAVGIPYRRRHGPAVSAEPAADEGEGEGDFAEELQGAAGLPSSQGETAHEQEHVRERAREEQRRSDRRRRGHWEV